MLRYTDMQLRYISYPHAVSRYNILVYTILCMSNQFRLGHYIIVITNYTIMHAAVCTAYQYIVYLCMSNQLRLSHCITVILNYTIKG